jgi:phage terminase large subunit-like protein
VIMAADIARTLNPLLLANDVGLTLDQWQADLICSTADRELLLCARQTGKSTICSLIALRDSVYRRPGGLVVIVSPSQRQSAEMLRTVMGMHSKLKGAPGLKQESVLKVELANGSRVVALPSESKTVRGLSSVDLLIVDEAARIEDDLLQAVRPMLAVSNGRMIMLSTPFGKRGAFFEAWTGSEDWHRVRVTAAECPRISKQFLDEELRELGAMRFSEEYGLEFLDPDEAVFPSAVIDAAFTQEVVPLWT